MRTSSTSDEGTLSKPCHWTGAIQDMNLSNLCIGCEQNLRSIFVCNCPPDDGERVRITTVRRACPYPMAHCRSVVKTVIVRVSSSTPTRRSFRRAPHAYGRSSAQSGQPRAPKIGRGVFLSYGAARQCRCTV